MSGANFNDTSKPALNAITYAYGPGTADVTLAQDTIADATGASISLTAGTWLIWGQITISMNAGTSYAYTELTNGSNVCQVAAQNYITTPQKVTMFVQCVVTPGSTTTYKMRGQSGAANNKIVYEVNAGKLGTLIAAIKLA